jgi:hypothetical protein
VPIIPVFFGIIIRMYYKEHDRTLPRRASRPTRQIPFFGEMTIGNIQSGTALRLIGEWAALHQMMSNNAASSSA